MPSDSIISALGVDMCQGCVTKRSGFLGFGPRLGCDCGCKGSVQVTQQHLGADERGRDRGTRAVAFCGNCRHRVRLG